ncbi:hypothetical protein ACSCB1_35285 [Streptomyces europaeiscabiei]|uniref:hypothetical protein n=1 Tax=Streptomyces europaeiscabiei TaxID=146819 RepID=UPI000A816D19|nr:hypothetical protein [Streptomyces europaeiscabiei]
MKRTFRLKKDVGRIKAGNIYERLTDGSWMYKGEKVVAWLDLFLDDYINKPDCLEEVPEKIDTPAEGKRWRAAYEEIFWAVNWTGSVIEGEDLREGEDDEGYKLGNYFKTEAQARVAAKAVQAVFRYLNTPFGETGTAEYPHTLDIYPVLYEARQKLQGKQK